MKIRLQDEQIIINDEIVLDVVEGEHRIGLIPKDRDAFWTLWHAHKSLLKLNGIDVFMQQTSGKPAWHIMITRHDYDQLKLITETTNGTT